MQLHAGFRFADAMALVPYLAGLGISSMQKPPRLSIESIESLGNHCFIRGRVARS